MPTACYFLAVPLCKKYDILLNKFFAIGFMQKLSLMDQNIFYIVKREIYEYCKK